MNRILERLHPARVGALFLLAALSTMASCGSGTSEPATSTDSSESAAFDRRVSFQVRGRLPDPSELSWRLENERVPEELDASAVRAAVERALRAWQDTGLVGFREATAAELEVDFTISWQAGQHGRCQPFGRTFEVAHTGGLGRGSFVHLNAGQAWCVGDRDALGSRFFLDQVVLHELGHVLGLGHSDDAHAVMRSGAADGNSELNASDLAGLRSLYGGPEPGTDDLIAGETVLYGIALYGKSDFAVFDSNGDGKAELFVWATDHPGGGALRVYYFDQAGRLSKTAGPFLGIAGTGAALLFAQSVEGDPFLITRYPNGHQLLRVISVEGKLGPWPGHMEVEFASEPAAMREGDLTGDGALERVRRGSS